MRPPTFPVAPSKIAEYCTSASAAVIVTSHPPGAKNTRWSGSERGFVVGRFLHTISTFTVIL
jgi:hypothetical protein